MAVMLRPRFYGLLFIVLLTLVAGSAWSVDVDQEELESQADRDIEFQNFQGPQEDIDTIEEITGIGSFLARPPLLPGESRTYFERYRILHAVDPDVDEGLDADILYILEDAQVDHIDNVRRILGRYLAGAYGYSDADAALLAELVTIYNAVHRGNLSLFRERYKAIVTENLSEEAAGISTLYSDWPGSTELVTPLSEGARPGRLGTIAPLELTDDTLIEQLRRRPDMGLEERRELVDFLDRVIEERREEIAQEREEIEEQRQALEEQEEARRRLRRGLRTNPPPRKRRLQKSPLLRTKRPRRSPPADEEPEDTPTEEELDQREAELDQEEEEVDQLEEEVREQREQIAEDTEEQIAEAEAEAEEQEEPGAPTPVTFVLSRREDGSVLRQLVRVQPLTGEVLVESPIATVTSANFVVVGGNPVVIADYQGSSRLLELESDSLEVRIAGEREIATGGYLVSADSALYAAVRDQGEWYLGRFDEALELRERSADPIAAESYIHVAGRRVFVQGTDGQVLSLNRDGFGE